MTMPMSTINVTPDAIATHMVRRDPMLIRRQPIRAQDVTSAPAPETASCILAGKYELSETRGNMYLGWYESLQYVFATNGHSEKKNDSPITMNKHTLAIFGGLLLTHHKGIRKKPGQTAKIRQVHPQLIYFWIQVDMVRPNRNPLSLMSVSLGLSCSLQWHFSWLTEITWTNIEMGHGWVIKSTQKCVLTSNSTPIQEERPPRGQLWMEQCLTSLKYWPI